MRIYSVQNVEFTGRLKHGDLLKKLNYLNQAAKEKAIKIGTNTANSSNISLNKTFNDAEDFTPQDWAKVCATGSGLGSSTISGRAATITEGLNTWSIYSIFS